MLQLDYFMQSIMQKPQVYIRLVTAGIALFYQLFLLPLREIVIYPGHEVKGVLLHLVLFAFLYYSHSYAVSMFFSTDKIRAVALNLLSGLMAVALTFFVSASTILEPAMNEKYLVRNDYIVIGDYLRDVHGLNIYYFDYSGWILTKYILVCILIFAFLSRVIGWSFPLSKQKSSRIFQRN